MRIFFQPDGTPLTPASLSRPADRLTQPDLATTLCRLRDDGPGALYEGDLGGRIVADLRSNGGLLTRRDLADFRLREFDAGLGIDYRGDRLIGLATARFADVLDFARTG